MNSFGGGGDLGWNGGDGVLSASVYKVSRIHVYDTPCVLCAMMHKRYLHGALHMDYGFKSERRK